MAPKKGDRQTILNARSSMRQRISNKITAHMQTDYTHTPGVRVLGMQAVKPVVFHLARMNEDPPLWPELMVRGWVPEGQTYGLIHIEREEALTPCWGDIEPDEGTRTLWIPTPEQIAREAAKIRKATSDTRRRAEPCGLPRDLFTLDAKGSAIREYYTGDL